MSIFKWKIENFANELVQSKRHDTLISPIYKTIHPVHGPLEFPIIYNVGETEEFSAWMRFEQMVCQKLDLSFEIDFWLEGPDGKSDQKTHKEILVNSKYRKNRSQGTLKCNFPNGYKNFDSLTVCFKFPLDVTTTQEIPHRTLLSCEIYVSILDRIDEDPNCRCMLTGPFILPQLPQTKFKFMTQNGRFVVVKIGQAPKDVVIQFKLWVEDTEGFRTTKIDDIFRINSKTRHYKHEYLTRYLRYLFSYEARILHCDATVWFEEPWETKQVATIAEIYNFDELADWEIRVENKKFKVSKSILAAHTNKLNGVVEINDVDVEMFELMIRYMYSNNVENLDSVAFDLLVVANRFKVNDLVELCVESVLKNLNAKSVTDRLKFFDQLYYLDEYKYHVYEYAEQCFGKIAKFSKGNNTSSNS
ncbi:hypothetical protein M3Y94_01053200 [Aphelenchoides besseyi]|nr:hypothetical protein M3Y94_01053200 [Aphelenchoides besseyi]KAI6224109.1 hypothetical protein M3Y95_00848600 [Aphelenchoides besseyi]